MTQTPAGWTDLYRPKTLDEMALAPELRERFEHYLSDGLSTSLILHGPPGFGKSTIAKIIADELYGGDLRVRRVVAPLDATVESVRDVLIPSMESGLIGGDKLLLLEEVEGLSPKAQKAFRAPLEDLADRCRMIFITNALGEFDPALQSRCDVIELGRPPDAECVRVLTAILTAEGITSETPDAVLAFVRWHFSGTKRDMRTLLREAQYAIATRGSLTWKESAGMVTLDVVVAMSLTHESVMEQLSGALTSTLVMPDPAKRRIVEFASGFLTKYRKLPASGDWTQWLETLDAGIIHDGTREVLGSIFAVDTSGHQPAFFAETALAVLLQGAENTARARINEAAAQGGLAPGTIAAFTEQLKAIKMRTVPKSIWPTLGGIITGAGGTAEETPPEELITGLAWRGRHVLLAGREKLGKSTYAAAGVVALTRGLVFLDRDADGNPIPRSPDPEHDRAGRVLWLAMDEAEGEAFNRLLAGGVHPLHIAVSNPEQPETFLATVLKRDTDRRPDVVVVDSLIEYARRSSTEMPESGSSAAWSTIMRGLTDLAHKCDVGIITIAHARKSDNEYRDSSEIGAAVDAIITMKPPGERQAEVVRNIRIDGRRSITERTKWYAVRLTARPVVGADGVQTMRDEYVRELPPQDQADEPQQDAAVATEPSDRQKVLDALPPGARLSGPDWLAASKCSKTGFYRERKELITEGVVVQGEDGLHQRTDVDEDGVVRDMDVEKQ